MAMTGLQLREILERKWGRAYDVQFFRRGERLYLQVMWLYLGQGSFAMSEVEYDAHLEKISHHLCELGVKDQVITFLERTREKPRIGRAVSMPLEVQW